MRRSAIVVLFLVAISSVEITFGGWPEPPWRVLPKLEFIHETANTIWFYSKKDEGSGWPPQYVVTYSKPDKELKFHTVIDERISKDGPISYEMKEESIPSYIQIEPEEALIRGVNIPVPEMTAEDLDSLSKWIYRSGFYRRTEPSEWGFSNVFSGGFVEIKGTYYLGLEGGRFEGYQHMGGLVVYYPSEEKIEVLRSKYLVGCSVINMKQIGDELFSATVDRSGGPIFQGEGGFWEEGVYNRTGLVLYNLTTGQWRNIPFSTPHTFIREMDVIDGQVWMTTNLGISRFDPKADEMKSWNWDLKLTEQP